MNNTKLSILVLISMMAIALAAVSVIAPVGGGNKAYGLPVGWNVTTGDFQTPVDEGVYESSTKEKLCLVKGYTIDAIPHACFYADFSAGNVNLSNIGIYYDDTNEKVAIDFDNVVPGDNIDKNNHELYISSSKWGNGGLICPDAKSIEDVNSSCVPKYTFSDAEADYPGKDFSGGVHVLQQTIHSVDFYQISGLNGSGAGANSPNYAVGFPSGWNVTTSESGVSIVEEGVTELTGKIMLYLEKESGGKFIPYAGFYGDFSAGNVSLSNINIYNDNTNKKVAIDFSSVLPGDNIDKNNHEIYINSDWNNGGFICPNANNTAQIVSGCSGELNFSHAESAYPGKNFDGGINVVLTPINEINLYKISGLNGSGAGANPAGGGGTAVPEFSDYALVLIVLTAIGGFYFVKRRKGI